MDYDEYLEQGETLASEGLVEEALSRFEQALETAPENPEVIEAVGRALLNLGRLEEAEIREVLAAYQRALQHDPQLYEAALDRLSREIAVVQHSTETEAVKEIEGQLAKSPRRGAKAEATEADEADVEADGDESTVADEAA